MIRYTAGFDFSGPVNNNRFTDPAFSQLPFDTSITSAAVEKSRVIPPFLMRSIIACKNNKGLLFQSQGFKFPYHFSDITVKLCHHSGIGGMGVRLRLITNAIPSLFNRNRLFIEFLFIMFKCGISLG
ncbi:hypothetical protein D3C86_1712870 [compost metagenome]